MATSNGGGEGGGRVLRYLGSVRNIAACVAGAGGLGLHFAGYGGDWWPGIVVGLYGAEPQKPEMDSFSEPVTETDWVKERAVTVPFTGIVDGDRDAAWQIENSPTYTLLKQVRYRREEYVDNEASSTQQSVGFVVSTGVSKSQTDTWEVKVGVSVSVKAGLEIGPLSGEVSATVSVEAGYSSARGVTEMTERSDHADLVVPGLHAGAAYSTGHSLSVVREDGTSVGGGGGSLEFTPYTSYYFVQYPKAADDATDVAALSRKTTLEAALSLLASES
ncbi:hypothetical protein ACWC5I_05530 [Kitasatospora sp. NPDC001574]